MSKIRRKLKKVDEMNADREKINMIISDIRKFLNDESTFQTNQELLGMRKNFRGTLVKSWTGDNFQTNKDRKNNNIIAKESVLFCSECWLDRCEAMHDEEKQRETLRQ